MVIMLLYGQCLFWPISAMTYMMVPYFEPHLWSNFPAVPFPLKPGTFPLKPGTSSRHDCNSVQFGSVAQSCPALCDPMNRSTPGLPVHHQLPEFTWTHVHRVSDAIQPSHPLSSPSPAPNPSQHQSLFQWVSSWHEVAKVLEFQLQHHSPQRNPRADLQNGLVGVMVPEV